MLKRQMKMRRKAIIRLNKVDDARCTVHRLEGADPKENIWFGLDRRKLACVSWSATFHRGTRHNVQQLDQRGVRREVATVGSEVDARECDLLEPRGDHTGDFRQ